MDNAVAREEPIDEALSAFDDLITSKSNPPDPVSGDAVTALDNLIISKTAPSAAGAVGNAATRAALRVGENADTWAAEAYKQRAEDYDRSFGEIMRDAYGIPEDGSVMTDDGRVTMSSDLIGSGLSGLYRYGMSRLNALGETKESLNQKAQQNFDAAAAYRQQSQNLPRSAPAQRYERDVREGKSWYEIGWNDPAALAATVGETSIESAPSMAAGIAAGAVTRNPSVAAAVMGGASYAQERYGSVLDFLSENGVDLSDPSQTKAALFNRELMAKADQYGITRGKIIGALDAVSGLFAGAELFKGPVKNFASQMALQAGFGGTGEAVAQGETKGYSNIDWNDVALEALAEFATAPVEVVGVGRQYLQEKNKPASDINVEEVLNDIVAGKPGAREALVAHGIADEDIDAMVARRAPEEQGTVAQVSEKGADAAEAAAINSTNPTNPTNAVEAPVAPKRDALLEIARRRDQRAKAAATPEVTPATPEQSQPVASPNAAGTEPPTAVGVGSAAPPATPAPNNEITANVPEPPAEAAGPQLTDIPYDTLTYDPQQKKVIASSGANRVIDYADRKIVVVNINGVQVPFYLSTGSGGKKNVAAGKWYPFFGIGKDGWINKTTEAEINNYYGIPELRNVAQELDRTIGDVRNDTNIPKTKATGAHVDFINTGLSPASNQEADTISRVAANIRDVATRLRGGAAPVAPAATPTATPEPEVTVPESQATLNAQRAELIDPDNERIAVEYPKGTNMELNPRIKNPKIERLYYKKRVFDFDATKTNRDKIKAAINSNTINELLGLGTYNKQEVAESAAAGATPVAVTERTPDGTEVKAAAGTEETAPEQLQALEESKAPENTVQVEDPRTVIEERLAATQEVPNAAPETVAAPKAEQAKATSKAREEKSEAAPAKPRVLEDLSPEGVASAEAAAKKSAEIYADEKTRIKKFLKGRGKEKTLRDADEKTGKNWTPAERAARRKLNEDSDKLVKDYAPTPQVSRAERDFMDEDAAKRKNARAAIRARAEAMLKAADDADISLPEKVYGNTDKSMDLGAGAMNLVVARDFLDALKSPYKPVEEHYIDFLSRDMRLRKGLLDEVVSERRTEIDDKVRQKQGGNIEQIATNTVGDTSAEADTEFSADTKDVADAKIVGKDDVETKVSRSAKMAPRLDDGTQKGELTVKTEDSEGNVKTKKVAADVAKPASEVRSVSAEEKARIEAQLRAMGILKRSDGQSATKPVRDVREDEVRRSLSLNKAFNEAGLPKGNWLSQLFTGKVTKLLREKVPDIPVLVVDQQTLDEMFPDKKPGRVDGYYDPQKDQIVASSRMLKNGKFDRSFLVHEGVHAYLQYAVDSSPTLKADIQELLDEVKSTLKLGEKVPYGLTDVHEFLAEALSNEDFQLFLASTKVSRKLASKFDMPTNGTLWDALVKKIAEFMGKLTGKEVDALSYALRLSERAAEIADKQPDIKLVRDMRRAGVLASEGRQRNYADELKAAGVPDDIAAELDAFIKEELGKAIDPATFDAFMEDLKAEYGQDTSASNDPMPEEEAKEKAKRAKAETEKEAKRMMRDTTKSREELLDEAYLKALEEFRPGRVPKQNSKALLSLLMNNQLALISDNFFGRNTNPVRRIADLIEMRRTGKQRYVEELGAVAQKLYDLERAYRKKDPKAWENFVSLAHDATMAQVHPDKSLDDEIHKYLGGDDALRGKWSKKQHPRLAAVYDSLPGDLQQLYRETRDALSATRDRVELGNISAVLRKMGHNDEALAKRFLEKKSTEADRKLVGDVVADYIENIVRLSAINGPYFNLARQGDIVLTGRYKVTTPSNGTKIKDGIFEFKSRDNAVKFAEEQMLRPTISRVAVDPKTGQRYFVDDDGTQVKATFADPNAEERYRVTVQTKYVEFFHSVAAAKEKAQALKDVVVLNDIEPKRIERSAANADMLSDQMRALASSLDTRLKGANLTPEQQAVLKGTLNEASLRFMASTRLQTHRLPRRYVQGASKDLVVSTYQYVDSSAGYLAKLDTQVELEDAMRQMEKAVNALSSRREGIGGGARAISNEVERRVNDIDYNMDNGLGAAVANRVMAVNFINHLMSPMYTVLQVVQTPLVAGPVLAGEYGAVRTSYHLTKASKDIGAFQIAMKGIAATAKGVAGVNTPGRTYTDYASNRLTGEERSEIEKLVKLGVVDADAGFDVTRLERKDNMLARGVDATLEYFSNIARAAPQSVETINRSVVGLAAFRMARKDGLSFDEAVRKAQEAVELTHFNLSASNAPPIFRNPVGRLLLQFKKYGQNIYFLHYYNAARVLRPKVKGDRLKGAKTLLYLAATHQIAAGIVGLPIEPLKIAVLVLGMIPGMPEWEDLERMAEEALAELTGKKGAEAMMFGLPRLANIDISSRVGLSSLLLFGEPGEMGDKDSVQSWFLNLLAGPTVGSVTDIAGGVGAVAEGDWAKAAEKLLPVKVISDALRAVRESEEGKFDTQDALMRAFGVQSARQARIQQNTSIDIDKRTGLKREKNAIIKAWISADTPNERARIIARMREYNKEAGKRDQLSKKYLENIRRKEMKKYEAE